MKALGKVYNDTEASTGDFERLPAGGYVCRIETVTDFPDKEYLSLVYDIAEGEKKSFYGDDWGKDHPNAHRLIMSYKEKALGMLKGRLRAIDESNGTSFEQQAVTGLDEKQLTGKLVGLIIGYEEYATDRGEVRERTYVKTAVSVEKIRKGEFKVPELKKLKEAAADPAKDGFTPFSGIDESQIPF